MSCTRRDFVTLATGAALLGLGACAQPQVEAEPEPKEEKPAEEPDNPDVDLHEFDKLLINTEAWRYDKENDVYYQLEVPYCLKPEAAAYESLAIFVPGAYFTPLKEERRGQKVPVEINKDAQVGSFTPATAPVVMPLNMGNLSPQASPTAYSYSGLANYLNAGYVYVYAGFRGKSSGYESSGKGVFSGGAPWPVVDLKAAVRFLRFNAEALPCDTSRVFTFGFGASGGVSAVVGSSGDSELYLPYLEHIGAVTHDVEGKDISDATFGSASWCPITSFDTADSSYEWMMGQYANNDTRKDGTWTRQLSRDLASDYAAYVNGMDLRDADDQPMTLDETSGELFADGNYYVRMLECIEGSAKQFFENTRFPYTMTPQYLVNADFPGDPNLQSEASGALDIDAATGDASAQAASRSDDGMTKVQSVVYSTAEDYVNDLNSGNVWLTYNQVHGSVRVSSMGDFVRKAKVAAKEVCAFDSPARSSIENQLFGVNEEGSLHFSARVRDVLVAGADAYKSMKDWDDELIEEWEADLAMPDELETSMQTRLNMFNPLYFLSGSYEGFGTAAVAPHWRINSGLSQTDTSLCTEMNLSAALSHYEGVADVAFTPVWGQGHVLAEVTGSAESNFISWVANCCKE